ncbi:MAG: FHA domain-containing protein [Lentisphaeria bacterium]|nr:FHA domain-containing protein [Lentisphaeria bacterium]
MAGNPKLTVLFEKLRGMSFELTGDHMTVGRREPVDICIKDASLSSHHCDLIRTESGSYIIRDMNSTNGTRVNNVPIEEQELKNSDIIQLGGVEVLYDCGEGTDQAAGGNLSHTISIDGLDSNLSTVRDLTNYSPFASIERKKQKRNNMLLWMTIVVLGLLLLALIGLVVLTVLKIKVF